MLRRSIEEAARKSAERAAKKAARKARNKEISKEIRLEYVFNTAAKLEEALTALQAANPKFDFLSEQNGENMCFVTNIPIKGNHEDKDMNIEITSMGVTLTLDDTFLSHRNSIVTPSVKKAARIVGKYVGKKGLAS